MYLSTEVFKPLLFIFMYGKKQKSQYGGAATKTKEMIVLIKN